MKDRITSVVAIAVLLAIAGCKGQDKQAATSSAPTVVQAATATSNAPAPPALPPISGHWTITFKQLRRTKDGRFIPGTDKNFGVLNVDLKDGVYVIEEGRAICSQNGDVYKNKFHDLNFLAFTVLQDDSGKPVNSCFASVGNFDGSCGQLSRTSGVLAMAHNEMGRQFKDGAPIPDAPLEREVTLKIQSDGDSGSYNLPPTHSFEAYAGVSGSMMSGMWCVATPGDGSRPSPYCGTLSGQRTSAVADSSQTTRVPSSDPSVAVASQTSADSNAPEPAAGTPTGDDLVLHDLKLGVPLDSQIRKCGTHVEGGKRLVLGTGLCYLEDTLDLALKKKTGWSSVDVAKGGQSLPTDEESEDFNVAIIEVWLVPRAAKEHGNVVFISSHYPEEQFDKIKEKIDAGAGYGPYVESGRYWSTAWGRITMFSGTEYFTLIAETTNFHDIETEFYKQEAQNMLRKNNP